MKKNIALIWVLLATVAGGAQVNMDSQPTVNQPVTLSPDDPEIAAIDKILVSNCLNHFCYSSDQTVLNPFGYASEQVPTFAPELVAARMQVLDKNTPFDLVYNSTVQGFIDLYAVRRRDISSKVLGASQMYFPMFEEKLAKYGIPLEMKYLAIVESALNPTIISSAGAGGLWQFMVATGKQYHLNITSYQDERFDAYKSTEAACQYLKFLYKTFGNWELALAAYNSGPGNVNKAIRRAGGARDFWAIKPYLPKETQGYVPAFIAVNYVMNHASEYNLFPKQPIASFFELDSIRVTQRVDFTALSRVLDIPMDDLCLLNGSYKLKEIPANGAAHYLVLPISKLGAFMANEALVYEQSKIKVAEPVLLASNNSDTPAAGQGVAKTVWETKWKTHTVKRGESLGLIASKYDVTLAQLKKWNHIKGSTISQGQKLKIETRVKSVVYETPQNDQTAEVTKPDSEKSGGAEDEEMNYQQSDEKAVAVVEKPIQSKSVKANEPTSFKYYTIQKGDTLHKIASSKGVSVEQIKKLNSGLKENKLAVGQKIKIKQI